MRRALLVLSLLMLGLSIMACLISGTVISFSPSQLPEARAGQAYQASITLSGNRTPINTAYVTDGSLPSGLSLAFQRGSNTMTVSGTPQEAGQFKFTVAVTCLGTNVAGQTGQQDFTLVVK